MCIDFYVRVVWEKTTWWPQPSHISSWILGLDNASCVVFVSLFQIMHGQLNYLWVSLLESIYVCYSFRLCLVGPLLNCVRLSGKCLLLSTHWQNIETRLSRFNTTALWRAFCFNLCFSFVFLWAIKCHTWLIPLNRCSNVHDNRKKQLKTHDTSYTGLLRSILRLIIADRVTFQREDIVPDSVCTKIIIACTYI